jgi:hypothetical protein
MSSSPRAAGRSFAFAMLLCSSAARAHDYFDYDYLNAGPLFTTANVDGTTFGVGGQLVWQRLHLSLNPFAFWHVGAYGELQAVGLNRPRGALGGEVGVSLFRLTAGLAVEDADKTHGTTLFVDLTPSFQLYYFALGCRVGLPLATFTRGHSYGVETGVSLTVFWPIRLRGEAGYYPHERL